jgi:hypothetical protein
VNFEVERREGLSTLPCSTLQEALLGEARNVWTRDDEVIENTNIDKA